MDDEATLPPQTHFVIASRKSPLALIQANHVKTVLSSAFPTFTFVIREHDTVGDQRLDVALSKIGDKGLFTKSLEESLLNGSVDLAVHSLKDMPTEDTPGLTLGAITERMSPKDVYVWGKGKNREDIKVIGTSSLRRRAQLLANQVTNGFTSCVESRGNLVTRLSKLDSGDCDALVLARAGLERQGLADRICEDVPDMMWAVGQGALGIQVRTADVTRLHDILACLNHWETEQMCKAERALMAHLHGGCHAPIGVCTTYLHSKRSERVLRLEGKVLSLDGKRSCYADALVDLEMDKWDPDGISTQCEPIDRATWLGRRVGQDLLAKGAQLLLNESHGDFLVPDIVALSQQYPLQNDTYLRACYGQGVDHVPVWLMRQAGRYLPGYKTLRQTSSFFQICDSPTMTAAVTIEPLDVLGVDAVILFSDIMVVPRALGFTVVTDDVHKRNKIAGPYLTEPLASPAEAHRLLNASLEAAKKALQPVYQALIETRRQLKGRVPLIGFAGGPLTLFMYLVDGSGSGSERKGNGRFAAPIVTWLLEHPDKSRACLAKLTDVVAMHLIQQVRHGAHALQIFDSHVGDLTPTLFQSFALPALEATVAKVRKVCGDIPIAIFARGAHYSISELAKRVRPTVLCLDQYIPLADACATLERSRAEQAQLNSARKGESSLSCHPCVVVQGNLDPLVLHSTTDVIERETINMLHSVASDDNPTLQYYIANLGHGCMATYEPSKVKFFVDTIHKVSYNMIRDARARACGANTGIESVC